MIWVVLIPLLGSLATALIAPRLVAQSRVPERIAMFAAFVQAVVMMTIVIQAAGVANFPEGPWILAEPVPGIA